MTKRNRSDLGMILAVLGLLFALGGSPLLALVALGYNVAQVLE